MNENMFSKVLNSMERAKVAKAKKRSKKPNKVQKAGKTAFRFLKHFTQESPKILWRIASFDSTPTEIRTSIILPLADMITRLKSETLTPEEKEFNNFKFILYWPELVLKMQGFFRKAVISMGYTAITKTPHFYRMNKSGELNQMKQEIQKVILMRFWKNIKKSPVQDGAGFIKRLKSAIDTASDFADQPQLQDLVKSVISELGFDELKKALSLKKDPKKVTKSGL